MKKTLQQRIDLGLKNNCQILTHVNGKSSKNATQTKIIISTEKATPTVNSKGNSKLQSENGKLQILTFARLGQFTRNELLKDGYNFDSRIPETVCTRCNECKGFCFNKKLYFRDNTINNRINNYLHSLSDTFISDIDNILKKYTTKFNKKNMNLALRWHVEGELTDLQYLEKVVEICKLNSNIQVYTYTKNYELLLENYKSIPKNLNIMVSRWDGQPQEELPLIDKLNDLGFKIYYARKKGSPLPTGFSQCKDDCNKCLNCVQGLNNASCEIH